MPQNLQPMTISGARSRNSGIKPAGLTPRQWLFVLALGSDRTRSASSAAREAGYSSTCARAVASRLLRDSRVRDEYLRLFPSARSPGEWGATYNWFVRPMGLAWATASRER